TLPAYAPHNLKRVGFARSRSLLVGTSRSLDVNRECGPTDRGMLRACIRRPDPEVNSMKRSLEGLFVRRPRVLNLLQSANLVTATCPPIPAGLDALERNAAGAG